MSEPTYNAYQFLDTYVITPAIMGTVFNWMLYGVLISQFYIYSYNFPDDGRRFKYLTYGMVLLETVQSGLALAELINLIRTLEDSVTHPFLISPWTGPFVLGCVAAMVVQFYFAYRIWVLSDKKLWWLCLTILFFSAIILISEIIGGAYVLSQEASSGRVLWVSAIIWLVGSVITDGIITISMLYLLKRRHNEGTSYSTKNAISKIVRLTVETNLLTTTVAIIALVLFTLTFKDETFDETNWSWFPIASNGKLYANALFASLNNRIAIRQGPGPNAAIKIPDATLSRRRLSNGTSDGMHIELDRPPSVMIFSAPKEGNRRSRESGEPEDSSYSSLVIDIA